jgi:predicted ATP-grasp superfamily ATP-dependent carboligase
MRVKRVLIAGVSARAAAASAVRAGFSVTVLDAFADLDLPAGVRGLSLPRDFGVPFSAGAAARLARDLACDTVVYVSGFENHPDAVTLLASGRTLWGNPPEVLRRVRNPLRLMRAFRQHGIPAPTVIMNRDDVNDPNDLNDPNDTNDPNEWLIKPLASGGGHGIRPLNSDRADTHLRTPRGHYLQQRIDGVLGSVVFVAAGGRAVVMGVSRQLAGDPAFGASGFQYCGNILSACRDTQFGRDEEVVAAAERLATLVADEFGLLGVNGVDFIAHAGVAYPVEVNPRWCASLEVVEHAYGVSMFEVHASACNAGTLPRFDMMSARQGDVAGKAIVFAREDVVIRDTQPWLSDASVRDVPRPGERIASGRPVCTVFSTAPDAAGCYAALVSRAERVYAQLAEWQR